MKEIPAVEYQKWADIGCTRCEQSYSSEPKQKLAGLQLSIPSVVLPLYHILLGLAFRTVTQQAIRKASSLSQFYHDCIDKLMNYLIKNK